MGKGKGEAERRSAGDASFVTNPDGTRTYSKASGSVSHGRCASSAMQRSAACQVLSSFSGRHITDRCCQVVSSVGSNFSVVFSLSFFVI